MDSQQQKQLRVFGYGLPLILIFLGLRHGFKHGWDTLSFCLFLMAIFILGVTIWNKPLLTKIFRLWMKGAHLIGMVMTGIILIVLYGIVFVPTAWVLKLMAKDFMHRHWDKGVDSYWIARKDSNAGNRQAYTQQF